MRFCAFVDVIVLLEVVSRGSCNGARGQGARALVFDVQKLFLGNLSSVSVQWCSRKLWWSSGCDKCGKMSYTSCWDGAGWMDGSMFGH